ncbi:MAG TPA: hypothetical protein VJV75_08125 [Candidatus Polarisedimenticolia bacterium]|nr:hypothetical protein [Candidatus Polarisedimenticolia bacterium]
MRHTPIILTLALAGAAALASIPAVAQQSPSHKLEEPVFNAAGHPAAGIVPSSTSHRITLGSLGDPIAPQRLFGSASMLDAGFLLSYLPPQEVRNILFTGPTTLVWDRDPSSDLYNLYRGLVSTLPGLGYGPCAQAGLAGNTVTDTTVPGVGTAFFYLVTAENRLGEEGSKGTDSAGHQRAGSLCP